MWSLYTTPGLAGPVDVFPPRLDRTVICGKNASYPQPLDYVPRRLLHYWADQSQDEFAKSSARIVVNMDLKAAQAYRRYVVDNDILTTSHFFIPGVSVTHPPVLFEFEEPQTLAATPIIRRIVFNIPHYRRRKS
jgi:hypothetical protein